VKVAYWVIAGLLAAVYGFSGVKKLVQSQDQLRPMMGWVDTMPMSRIRMIGLLEVLGTVGVIVPPLSGIAPGMAVAAGPCDRGRLAGRGPMVLNPPHQVKRLRLARNGASGRACAAR
jgi:hypothetical protein